MLAGGDRKVERMAPESPPRHEQPVSVVQGSPGTGSAEQEQARPS